MNRRTLLKTAAAPLGVAGAAASDVRILDEIKFVDRSDGASLLVDDGLFPFQREMWDDYLKFDYNLFILPRKGGKTFMYQSIINSWKEEQPCVDGFIARRDNEWVIDNGRTRLLQGFKLENGKLMRYQNHVPKLTILATINSDNHDFLRDMWYGTNNMGAKFNKRRYPMQDIIDESYNFYDEGYFRICKENSVDKCYPTMEEEAFKYWSEFRVGHEPAQVGNLFV